MMYEVVYDWQMLRLIWTKLLLFLLNLIFNSTTDRSIIWDLIKP